MDICRRLPARNPFNNSRVCDVTRRQEKSKMCKKVAKKVKNNVSKVHTHATREDIGVSLP